MYPRTAGTVHSPPSEGWPMHFAMHAFSSHVEILNEVTPIEPVGQSVALLCLYGSAVIVNSMAQATVASCNV